MITATNSQRVQPLTITGSTTITLPSKVILCNSAAAITATLPSAASSRGTFFEIKKINTGDVTVDPAGAETIDGATNFILSALNSSVTIFSNGTEWKIL